MATLTVTKGYNNPTGWISGETVTPEKLNSSQTPSVSISAIQTADISDAQITADKLALGAVTGAAGGGKLAESAISGQTAITALEGTDAFLVWDDTDDTLKKITQTNLSTQIVGDASITAAKINGVAKDGSGNNIAVGNPPIFGCRAWVNFNGTRNATDTGASSNGANVLIRAGGNVSSVLKNATGDYTITFTTAMPDANYAACITQQRGDSAGFVGQYGIYGTTSNAYTSITSSTLRIKTNDGGANTGVDHPAVCVAIFR
jgi:hypothetical protein